MAADQTFPYATHLDIKFPPFCLFEVGRDCSKVEYV